VDSTRGADREDELGNELGSAGATDKRGEDQDDILMIGGIGLFLPCAQEEVEIGVADGAVAEQSQWMMTFKEELEQVFETAQAQAEAEEAVALKLKAEEGKENENSEERLNDFSQEDEEAVELKLTKEEAEEDDEHSGEWLKIFIQEDEKTTIGEFAAEEEGAYNICFAELWQ
jgi:hypothetical protein